MISTNVKKDVLSIITALCMVISCVNVVHVREVVAMIVMDLLLALPVMEQEKNVTKRKNTSKLNKIKPSLEDGFYFLKEADLSIKILAKFFCSSFMPQAKPLL